MSESNPTDHRAEHFKSLAEGDHEVTNGDLYNFAEHIIETLKSDEDDTEIAGRLDDNSPYLSLSIYKAPKSGDKPYDTMNIEVEHVRSSEFIEIRKSTNGEVSTWWNIPEIYSYLIQDDVIEEEYKQVRLSARWRRIMFDSLHTLHTQSLAELNQPHT